MHCGKSSGEVNNHTGLKCKTPTQDVRRSFVHIGIHDGVVWNYIEAFAGKRVRIRAEDSLKLSKRLGRCRRVQRPSDLIRIAWLCRVGGAVSAMLKPFLTVFAAVSFG